MKNYLYRERTLGLWTCPSLKEWSRPDESERSFRLRLSQASRERRDKDVEKLRAKYAPKMAAIQQRIERARERMAREEADATRSTWDATIAVGSSVLGALLGRKGLSKADVTRVASATKASGRAFQKQSERDHVAESLDTLHQKYTELELEFRAEVEELVAALHPRRSCSNRWRSGRRSLTSRSIRWCWHGLHGRLGPTERPRRRIEKETLVYGSAWMRALYGRDITVGKSVSTERREG